MSRRQLVSRQNPHQGGSQFSSTSTTNFSRPRRKDERHAKSSFLRYSDYTAMVAKYDDRVSPEPSPTKTATVFIQQPPATSPVPIPVTSRSREPRSTQKHHRHSARRAKDVHLAESLPPSVAALLAVTSIPPLRSCRTQRTTRTGRDVKMTVDAILKRSQQCERELSLTLGKSPLDLLLSAPEDLEVDDVSTCDSAMGSALSTRTVSLESMPSLGEAFSTDTLPSPGSPESCFRHRKAQPVRKNMEPLASPAGQMVDHPLSVPDVEVDVLDFRAFEQPGLPDKKRLRDQFRPFRTAFKSNLTASLRALRQAARSFSTMNFPSIPPEDFLTRSILTIDPQVPFTDERRPALEQEPTAELRRYLNPITAARIERPASARQGPGTRPVPASIQMQTYRVYRSRSAPPASSRIPYPTVGPSARAAQAALAQNGRASSSGSSVPGPRQREIRENSGFIRIAVLEMAMRKLGKLDDSKPSRARWALPPRRTSFKPYEIGPDGVPARWVAISAETMLDETAQGTSD